MYFLPIIFDPISHKTSIEKLNKTEKEKLDLLIGTLFHYVKLKGTTIKQHIYVSDGQNLRSGR